MSEKILTGDELSNLCGRLQGSSAVIGTVIEEMFGHGTQLSLQSCRRIDDQIFQCTLCGWWFPQNENFAEFGEE